MTVDSWHTPSHSPDADPSWTKGVGLEHHNLVSPHDRLDTRWVGGRSERSRGGSSHEGRRLQPTPAPGPWDRSELYWGRPAEPYARLVAVMTSTTTPAI